MDLRGTLLVCDMDGTLLNSENRISDENLQALTRYTQSGGKFTLATGRTEVSVKGFMERLPVNAPAILGNGTLLYDFQRGEAIWSLFLEKGISRVAQDILDAFPETGVLVYKPGRITCLRKSQETEICRRNELAYYNEQLLDEVREPWLKILIADKPEKLERIEKYLDSKELPIRMVRSTSIFLEILPPGVSKGTALDELIKVIGCRKSDVYAVGDNLNDIELLNRAGVGIAVKNAHEELKKSADICVCSNDEHMVVEVVKMIEQNQSI
ncbi:MAG: HAD family hydrolase [Acetivibrionales bacterium]|jgi:Cof subfamily protein (haloacid dehalogenase superfamily)